jgi:hypothetical protein
MKKLARVEMSSDLVDLITKEAGFGDRALKAGTALSVAGALGMGGYAGRHEYKAMAQGAVDAARTTRHQILKKLKDKKIINLPKVKHASCGANCKFEKSAGAARRFSEFAGRQMLHAGRTLRDFKTPIKSMKHGWTADNTLGRAMTVGGAALDLHSAAKREDPNGQGRSRLERIGAGIGNTAGGLIGMRHGMFTGGIVGGVAGGAIGGGVGRMLSPRKPVQPPPQTGA